MTKYAGRSRVKHLKNSGSWRKIPGQRPVDLVVYQACLFKADGVAVCIEHLLKESCAGARMSGEQSETPWRLEFDGISPPAIQDCGGDDLHHLLVEGLLALALGCQLHCLGALNCLHFQQSGHGLIVLACTIQNA